MTGPREPKKSETFEVRLSYEAKRALIEKARAEGRSASEVIRASIDRYLAEQRKENRSMFVTLWKPAAAVGAASLAMMWAALSPAPTQATPNLRSIFQMLDRNHDGVITFEEFIRDSSDPAIEKMHHAHMKNAAHKEEMTAEHAKMMQSAHGKPSDQALRAHFAEIDRDNDGSVTFAEFQAFHDRMKVAHGH
jgi:hypothetical protein